MRFSDAWIREYVALVDPPEAVGRRLTAAGLPVDGIEPAGAPGGLGAVYDLDISTNRPDCMNHLGVAREAAAIYGLPLRPPAGLVPPGGAPTLDSASVEIEDPARCARYAARCILGVRVAASPDWLRDRLEQLGHRSINNVVDATNFVLWEMGQPLHPFDLDRIDGRRVIVRQARAGERLVTLDGVERRLTPDILVIADARQPIALAGIMGGQASQIGPATRHVFLESAWFDPVGVRLAGKTLGMHTDASHRFERGADPGAVVVALDRAAALIAELAGGQVSDPPLDLHPGRMPERRVGLRPSRAVALLGHDPGEATMREALERRGFRIEGTTADRFQVSVPSYRRDIEREVDLIEEVARHAGYDAIPAMLPLLQDTAPGRGERGRLADTARSALLAAGLSEAINFAMGDRDEFLLFEPLTAPLQIENPLQSQAASLRTTLLPGLLRNLARNLNHGQTGCHLFEIGRTFRRSTERPDETLHVAAVFVGRGLPAHWSFPRREVDLHDARGAAELLLARLGVSAPRFSSDRIPPGAPIAGLTVTSDGRRLGVLGEVAKHLLKAFEVEGRVFAFEMDIESLPPAQERGRLYRSLPRYPAVRRDLALLVPDSVELPVLEETIRATSPLPIAAIQLFDRYRGRGIPPGQASLALQILFQSAERTLESAEVQTAQEAIVKALQIRHDVRLRGPVA